MTKATTAILLLAQSSAFAVTIRVPEDIPTLLAAADLAAPGDSVLVGPGIWSDREPRLIGGFQGTACAYPRGGVVIRGQGAGVTILDAGGSATAVGVAYVNRIGEGPLRLESMTLTGVGWGGAAVAGSYSDWVQIRSCRFEGNESGAGHAVSARECAVLMADCDVIGNVSPFGAVSIFDSYLELSGCRFEGNVGKCIVSHQDEPRWFVLRDCEFVRNRGVGSGVCVRLENPSVYVIEGCLFLENVAETGQSGAGVQLWGGTGQIRSNVFAYDSCYAASSRGAGLRLEGGISVLTQVTISNNTFVGCYSTLGGAAFSSSRSTVAFRGNVVAHCGRGSAISASTSVVTENNCNIYWANTGGNFENWTPSPTDVFADPLFCDLQGLDFTVRNDSPCMTPPTPSCAPIGALGIGCGIVSVEPSSFGRIKALFH